MKIAGAGTENGTLPLFNLRMFRLFKTTAEPALKPTLNVSLFVRSRRFG